MENVKRTFDVKQKAMVNKLHNMQWLKHASHSLNPGKVKRIQKLDANNKLKVKDLLTENIETLYSIEDSHKYHSMDPYKRDLSIDAMQDDAHLPNPFPNSKMLINCEDKGEKKNMLMVAKSIATAKLDAQCYSDKMKKDQSNQKISQNNAEDIMWNVCSNFSNLQVDPDMQELNLRKRFDGNNNYSKSTQSCMPKINNKQKPTIRKVTDKNIRASMETKDKDSQKTINALKRNIKDEDSTSNNDEPSILINNSKRSISNLSKTPPLVNKDIKVVQFDKKTISAGNKVEKIKDANSSLMGTDFETKFNKTVDMTYKSNSINKDGILQKQYTVSEQSASKMQEPLEKNAQKMDYAVCKTDTLFCNNEHLVKLVNATYLTDGKKFATTNEEPILGQCGKEMERFDKSKIDIDQQCIEINNVNNDGQTNSFTDLSNLFPNEYSIETPANVIRQYPRKLEYIQHMDDTNTLRSNQITWNNQFFNTVQKNATIINLQQPIQDTCFNTQKISAQARDDMKQTLSREPNNKLYYQYFPVSNAMRMSQIPSTFNMAALHENNIQASNNSDTTSILEATMNPNKENSNVLYKYAPNMQQRFGTTFSGHPILSDQTSRLNPLVQDDFSVNPNNPMRPTMRISNSNSISGPDDSNNRHIMNCPVHPIIYAPSPNVQMWNPQSQYLVLPVFNNSAYANCNVIPNAINQSNNYNSIGSMHGQQLKYIPCMQTNNNIRDTRSDLSINCTAQARSVIDNIPVKSSQRRKKDPDNFRMIYKHVTSLSYSGSQQDVNFMPTTDTDQHSDAYPWQIQKHRNQNVANYVQMSKYPKSRARQDLACDDNEAENIPPIISPKEFVTINRNLTKN